MIGIVNRRDFLFHAGLAALVARPWSGRTGALLERLPPTGTDDVSIVEFSDAGVRIGLVHVAKVVKSDSEWRRQLSELAFEVAREGATEVPFTGAYWNLHDKGLFRCVCCGTALFSSMHKFDSGTGWPSFWQPIAGENVAGPAKAHATSPTESEVRCKRCDAHLGDCFDDGPRPTGFRYCIDSVSLRFVKAPQ